MIPPSEHKVTTNDKGEWQQDLVASHLYNRSYQFKVSYYEGESLQPTTEDWGYYEIPSQSEILWSVLTVKSSFTAGALTGVGVLVCTVVINYFLIFKSMM